MMMIRWVCALVAAGAMLLVGCMDSGGGIDIGNPSLAGRLIDSGGQAVPYARMLLLAEGHDPSLSKPAADSVLTDGKGRFTFPAVPAGVYNVEAQDREGNLGLMQKVQVAPPRGGDPKVRDIGPLAVAEPSIIALPLSDSSVLGAVVYLPGTSVWAKVEDASLAAGFLELKAVPASDYPSLRLRIKNGDPSREILSDSLRVPAGTTVVVGADSDWRYSRTYELDGGASGAALTEDLYAFPLLVRLVRPEFDFASAAPDGRDLRFTKSDGRAPLAHAIERWDSAAGKADVWVHLDTAHAGETTVFRMFWGNSKAGAQTGGQVFDTTAGFRGVWHLGEVGNTVSGGYKDATGIGLHATATGMGPGSEVDGVVGKAQAFDGTDDVMTAAFPKGLNGGASFSVSYWMKFDPTPLGQDLDSLRMAILIFGRDDILKGFHFLIRGDTTTQFGAVENEKPPASNQNAFSLAPNAGKWAHVATVYDSSQGILTTWLDGVQAASNKPERIDLDPAFPLIIGKNFRDGERRYKGALDEIQVLHGARTKEWLRLVYLNQRPGASLPEPR